LMSMIVKGVITGGLPYTLVGVGVILGIIMIVLQIPVLPFALGLYLPLSLTTATMVGALVRAFVNRGKSNGSVQERGTLLAAGLIGGDACIGIAIALLALWGVIPVDAPGILPEWCSLFAYGLLAFGLAIAIFRKKRP